MKPTMLVALLLVGSGAHAAVTQPELADLTLEELADIRVTSVSRRSELLADTPASVFVITGEEIRRAGALTLPEALRLAPNLQVARIDARNYAVTARGFNNGLENKLLVMIDGRTIYSPLFSGVFWDAQDLVIEDIERIEVISGPGATMWGANAVNGVISVITRSAADTQGSLASVSMGREFRDLAVRHGGKLEGGGQYRVYGKFAENENTESVTGIPQPYGWHRKQAGFRADWNDGGQQVSL
ncbi:MAG: hypothetical protein JWP36_1312, partial [Paucimonas sp.]|nr:hypothetical protein [Paucimonas sp.]